MCSKIENQIRDLNDFQPGCLLLQNLTEMVILSKNIHLFFFGGYPISPQQACYSKF